MGKKGDDGFGGEESQHAADCAAYASYKSVRRNCKYTHKQALNHIGYDEDEFEELKAHYEPTDEMLS